MRHLLAPALAALLFATLSPRAARADSMSCHGAFVSNGASRMELVGKCGEPTQQDSHVEDRASFSTTDASGAFHETKVSVTVDKYVYDFGPGEFVRFVTLENGKIVSIVEGGYGHAHRDHAPGKVQVSRCDPLRDFVVGDSADQVLERCGEPVSRETKQVELTDAAPDGAGGLQGTTRTVQAEVWSYNFGASSFMRLLHFRDGKLVKIVTGGYGFGG